MELALAAAEETARIGFCICASNIGIEGSTWADVEAAAGTVAKSDPPATGTEKYGTLDENRAITIDGHNRSGSGRGTGGHSRHRLMHDTAGVGIWEMARSKDTLEYTLAFAANAAGELSVEPGTSVRCDCDAYVCGQ